MTSDIFAIAPIWFVAFLFSTVCHEAAHALVAKWGGDDTAYAGGQVTLDPIPHIKREPFGLVIIPLLSFFGSAGHSMFGWGSAPFDPIWQIRYPRRAALMALAGPVTNFIIAFAAAVLMHIGISQGLFVINFAPVVTSPHGAFLEGLALLLSILFVLNIILGVFNLIPMPPLDGYSVLGLFLPERTFLQFLNFASTSGFSIFGVLVAFQIFPYLMRPVLQFAMMLFLSTIVP